MNWLISLLKTPSAFAGDPWGYARNQIGHAYLVGAFGAYLLPLWAVLLIYAAWETIQRQFYRADLSDNLDDFANVAIAACAVAAGDPGYLAIHAIYLASGFCWRKGI